MAIAFGATLISGPHVLCPDLKVAIYKVQMPEVSVEAGHTMDVSGAFDYVYGMQFGPSGASGDFGYLYGSVGTYAADGTAAASVKIVHHFGQATVGAFDILTAGTDMKAVDDMYVTVWGK
jgi:hypothetical protein